jgi:resuscitation-promoting factor RpfB
VTRATRYRRRARRVARRWLRRRDRRALLLAALAGLVLAVGVHAARSGNPPATPPATAAAPTAVAGNVALGQRLAGAYGWGSGPQWDCLYALWQRESGWSATAENPRSGAYGIAQALGHGPTNQYPAGPANPPVSSAPAQIGWGLGYIDGTYGKPCAAWAHEQADSWY